MFPRISTSPAWNTLDGEVGTLPGAIRARAMTRRGLRELVRGGGVGYSLISELELVVISIIIFSRRRSLQLRLEAVWNDRA